MKFLVFISICCISQTAAVSTEVKTKMTPKANAIPAPQKPEFYYQQTHQQIQPNYVPVQLMQKPFYAVAPQQPQATMLIIAQPAYVPQNVIYGHQGGMQQQLLNYFHTNPQAKYQLLYGGYQQQQPTHQQYIAQHPLTSPSVAAYQVVPNPIFNGGYNQLVQQAPAQMSFNQASPFHSNQASPFHSNQASPFHAQQTSPFHSNQIGGQFAQPMQLSQLAQLAQLSSQQFQSPVRSLPPIITGFENFTPEQQVQIKAQLGAHLGVPATTASAAPATTSQYPSTLAPQAQPTQSLNTHDYMQSQEKNVAQPTGSSTSFTPSLIYRAQYTKG